MGIAISERLIHTHTQSGAWDLLIAHPPCTYLTVTGNRWFNVENYGMKAVKRAEEREKAAQFFMLFVNAECDRIAIENPVGYIGESTFDDFNGQDLF